VCPRQPASQPASQAAAVGYAVPRSTSTRVRVASFSPAVPRARGRVESDARAGTKRETARREQQQHQPRRAGEACELKETVAAWRVAWEQNGAANLICHLVIETCAAGFSFFFFRKNLI